MHADDASLFLLGTSPNDMVARAITVLTHLKEWIDFKSLKINFKRTKAVFFLPINRPLSISTNIYSDGQPTEFLITMKALGLPFSKNFSWDNHINHVQGIINGLLHKWICPSHKRKQLIYNAFIFSHLTHCQFVWRTTS